MSNTDLYERIKLISKALDKKFPEGKEPFKIVTRIAEEVGELATEVNHMERSGAKVEKHGEPDKQKLADEAKDVIHTVIQLVEYYDAEKELREEVEESIQRHKEKGLIEKEEA